MSELITFSLALTAPAFLGFAAGAAALAAAAGVAIDWLVRVGSTPIDQVDSELMRAYRAARRRHQSELARGEIDREVAASLAAARAALEALEAQPALAEVANRFRPGSVEEARRLVAQTLAAGSREVARNRAAEALSRLDTCLAEARGILEDLHRRANLLAVSEALNALGYQVRAAARSGEAVLWATRGSQAVALAAGRAGQLSMDLVGFDGLACRHESQRILGELARRGFQVGRQTALLHGRRSGGPLAAKVSRLVGEAGGEPAEVLVAGLPAVWAAGTQPGTPKTRRFVLARLRTQVGGR
jgi:hypothetical protein